MRFGLFISPGLAPGFGGHPVENHWATMRDLALYADRGAWDSVWVYDHFHRADAHR